MTLANSDAGVSSSYRIDVLLRNVDGGPVLAVEPVTERDYYSALSELWLESRLRKGHPDAPLEVLTAKLTPLHTDGWGDGGPSRRICAGFALEADEPGGERVRCVFGRSYTEHVALRAARKLVAANALAEDAVPLYELRAERVQEPLLGSHPPAPVASEPLTYVRTELAPFMERSEARGPFAATAATDASDFPVFYTRQARERAEHLARKGGSSEPPIETGGLLVGPLCSCPATGELFAVVVDVIEATHAEGTTYSLTFSGETWARVQAAMRARRANPATASHRILGQAHGHSFLPLDGAAPCDACPTLEVCSRTTAFLSAADLAWCRAVFHGQPWQLGHIFGFDALGREVEEFFGQRHGRLAARGYRVLEDFAPDFDPLSTSGT